MACAVTELAEGKIPSPHTTKNITAPNSQKSTCHHHLANMEVSSRLNIVASLLDVLAYVIVSQLTKSIATSGEILPLVKGACCW